MALFAFVKTKGRKGKGVTTVSGFDLDANKIKSICKQESLLHRQQGGVIEIQGDHRDQLKQQLDKMGYKVKLAGG